MTLVGKTTPRLWTQPLATGEPGPCGCGCSLTRETSLGFSVLDFAEYVGMTLFAWQRLLLIHGMELLPDGRPRFRTVLALVSRQQGKTTLLKLVSLYWLFVQQVALVMGLSTKLDTAKESWEGAVSLALSHPELASLVPEGGVRRTNGEQTLSTIDGCRYKIAAANADAARGLTVGRLILDELRQQKTWDAWGAATKAMMAVPDAQAWAITNAGSDSSIVLNTLRTRALEQIKDGPVDGQIGIFEWSAPDGCRIDDREAWAQANPSLGYGLVTEATIASALSTDPESVFRVEVLCSAVAVMNPAVDPDAWLRCLDLGTLDDVRSRVALCLDVSLDAQHATLAAAALLDDGRVRVEPVKAWQGAGCTIDLERDLPGLVARIKPRALGWFPTGPAASVAVALKKRPGWPPRGVRVEALRGEAADVCMGFAAAVDGGLVAHSADPLLDAHVTIAEPLRTGDRWVFTRRGGTRGASGHVDALYAAAGAAHLARSLPRRVGSTRGFVAREPGERRTDEQPND